MHTKNEMLKLKERVRKDVLVCLMCVSRMWERKKEKTSAKCAPPPPQKKGGRGGGGGEEGAVLEEKD